MYDWDNDSLGLKPIYCFKDFDEWWNADEYNWQDNGYMLVEYCWDYRHIWCLDKRGRDLLFKHLNDNNGYLPIVKVNNGY